VPADPLEPPIYTFKEAKIFHQPSFPWDLSVQTADIPPTLWPVQPSAERAPGKSTNLLTRHKFQVSPRSVFAASCFCGQSASRQHNGRDFHRSRSGLTGWRADRVEEDGRLAGGGGGGQQAVVDSQTRAPTQTRSERVNSALVLASPSQRPLSVATGSAESNAIRHQDRYCSLG